MIITKPRCLQHGNTAFTLHHNVLHIYATIGFLLDVPAILCVQSWARLERRSARGLWLPKPNKVAIPRGLAHLQILHPRILVLLPVAYLTPLPILLSLIHYSLVHHHLLLADRTPLDQGVVLPLCPLHLEATQLCLLLLMPLSPKGLASPVRLHSK